MNWKNKLEMFVVQGEGRFRTNEVCNTEFVPCKFKWTVVRDKVMLSSVACTSKKCKHSAKCIYQVRYFDGIGYFELRSDLKPDTIIVRNK